MAAPSLRIVDAATGELSDPDSLIAELELHVSNLERELRGKRRRISQLEHELEHKRRAHELRPVVERIFDHWRVVCRHPRSILDEKRAKACTERLEDGYSEAQCRLAIEGLAYDPNRKRTRNGRWELYNDMELALRSAENLERYANRAPM